MILFSFWFMCRYSVGREEGLETRPLNYRKIPDQKSISQSLIYIPNTFWHRFSFQISEKGKGSINGKENVYRQYDL